MSFVDKTIARGSIAEGIATTGDDGTAIISFPAQTTKPVISLAAEGDYIVVVDSWITDAAGNFVGVKLKALTLALSTLSNTAVTWIPSTTGDAHGRYTLDASGYLHHDHVIGSPTTASFLTSASLAINPVVNAKIHYIIR